jgi:D-tyrosyl-tRNA(Tyr) deacylase
VRVDGDVVGRIGVGWSVLLGVGAGDDVSTAERLAAKVVHLRGFDDEGGRMNRSALDLQAEILLVSQFTLYADTRRGRRPYFGDAAPPAVASDLVEAFAAALERQGIRVANGRFGARMELMLIADGPVTIWLDTAKG